ncbi:fibronectin type III domain-containing protein [Candidatus Sumerlaeota bacterium]|nr:fibronectin type III domain-containing protein [Candidatus Sumerlaeota bacterium]
MLTSIRTLGLAAILAGALTLHALTQSPSLPEMAKLRTYLGEADQWTEPEIAMRYRGTPPDRPATIDPQPQGILSGRIVFTCGGHGWTCNINGEDTAWYCQRGDWNDLVEDLGNADQLALYVEECFNAGATVVPFRPVGQQDNEVLIDNDDPQVSLSGLWSESVSPVFYGHEGDVPYLFANATSSGAPLAVARYTPDIPVAGFYPVYCWARDGLDRVSDQRHLITHSGGTSEVRINHRRVGKGWIYLGTYHFERGTGGHVEITNESSDTTSPNPRVIADAIRFGNGMGDVDRGRGISGQPRADEAAMYWLMRGFGQGLDTATVVRPGMGDQSSNVGVPARMAALMNRETEGPMTDRVYLGFHTNAFDPGSLGLFNGNNTNGAAATPNQERWAELIAAESNDDLVAIGSPPLEMPWPNRRALGLSLTLDRGDIEFGEINNASIHDEFDATIIEVASHGLPVDATLCLDPRVRRWVARASLQATVRYFHEFGGGALLFSPDPPVNARVIGEGPGRVIVSWDPPLIDPVGGSAPSGYRVERSSNGLGFDGGVEVEGALTTSLTLTDVEPGEIVYLRVRAINDAGQSLPSATVAARAGEEPAPVLIVNGFDRFDRALCVRQRDTVGSSGVDAKIPDTFSRIFPRRINSFDYVIQAAEAIDAVAPELVFDSCQNEAIESGDIDLAEYRAVIWMLGREASAEETFSATEQERVIAFLAGGGDLFVSGSEIAWDLDRDRGPTFADRVFLNTWLHADLGGDENADARTLGVRPLAGRLFGETLGLFLDDGNRGTYAARQPDILTPVGPGVVAVMRYAGGRGGTAAVAYDGSAGGGRVILFGFPFETIVSPSARADVMERVLEFFEVL